ncbi:aminoglycoside phosphotransferase [Streptomyces sp. NPDC026206]|uniref:aminoglycoside phosphotransferase n=1 Tax=Streptomyces sp. NPDC026206 TaxID=3157089 RepID=UPI0034045DFF
MERRPLAGAAHGLYAPRHDDRGTHISARPLDAGTQGPPARPGDTGQEPALTAAAPPASRYLMAVEHTDWAKLPEGVRDAVARQLGMPYTAADAEDAANSGTAALLSLCDGRAVFVKGQRDRTPAAAPDGSVDDGTSWWGPDWSPVDELDLEQAVNPHLPSSAPRVLWRLHAHGWHLLAFEGLRGRVSEYTPGSTDLPLVAAALGELAACATPPLRLPTAWDRWGYYCDARDEDQLAGSRLLHTDPASTNVLICQGRARLVDWAWPSLGPGWADAALWGMRLISTGGHTPEQAWTWASQTPGWNEAPPQALRVFTRAEARRWQDLAADHVAGASPVAEAAHAWACFVASHTPAAAPVTLTD